MKEEMGHYTVISPKQLALPNRKGAMLPLL